MNVRELDDTRVKLPAVMKSLDAGLVMLVIENNSDGTCNAVILIGNSSWEPGEYGVNFEYEKLSIYDGNIVLSNF